MRHATVTALAALGFLAGCAGREPVIEPTMRTEDTALGCAELMIAHDDAITRAAHKQKLQDDRDGADVALAVTGAVLFWPALFFIDTKNAEGVEAQNLVQRASSLRELAASKDCHVASWRPLPELRRKQGPAYAVDDRPETRLSDNEIRSAFADRQIEVMNRTMSGYRLEHAPDGTMRGVAPGGGESSAGRWDVEDGRYCVESEFWRRGRRSCYGVYDRGEDEFRLEPGDPALSYYAKRLET